MDAWSSLVPLLHSCGILHEHALSCALRVMLPVHSTMWLFPCCRMATSGSTELPPRGLWGPSGDLLIKRCDHELLYGAHTWLRSHRSPASETSPGSVITVMHITSALIHSNTALHLFCSLYKNKAVVFLYIRKWRNQIRFILQALLRCSSQCLRFKDAIVSQCWKVVFKSLFCVSWFAFTVLISTWITWLFTAASCRSWAGEPFQGISSTSSLFSSSLPVLSFNLF